jgi:hypothetical protein
LARFSFCHPEWKLVLRRISTNGLAVGVGGDALSREILRAALRMTDKDAGTRNFDPHPPLKVERRPLPDRERLLIRIIAPGGFGFWFGGGVGGDALSREILRCAQDDGKRCGNPEF